MILASHFVITGYGHWLPNDLRGSGSTEVRREELEDLGEIHPGRKPTQPSREELRAFFRKAEPALSHPTLWFDAAMRQATADAIARTVAARGYTLWALAVLRHHAHALIRAHRDHYTVIWHHLTQSTRDAILRFPDIAQDHPVWSGRPYAVFLHMRDEIPDRIDYINRNPGKDGLPAQRWSFVAPFTPS